MNETTIKFLLAVAGVPIGLLTYFFTKLWMEPYFEYEKLRAKITADLFFYGNAIEIDLTNKDSLLYKRYGERCEAFRKHAADLITLCDLLPSWHRTRDWEVEENPQKAISPLLVYANASDASLVRAAQREISEFLCLSTLTY